MTTGDVERIRFVTRHFNDLQGLRYWVPLGMITLSVGGTTYFSSWSFVVLRAALFLGGLLLMLGLCGGERPRVCSGWGWGGGGRRGVEPDVVRDVVRAGRRLAGAPRRGGAGQVADLDRQAAAGGAGAPVAAPVDRRGGGPRGRG